MDGIRYTEKDAKECFKRLVEVLNINIYNPSKPFKEQIGYWRLDYNPVYGGVVIEEIINERGGVTRPLGDSRLSIREFCNFVHLFIRTLDYVCKKQRR